MDHHTFSPAADILCGLALGDAFGAPVEFHDADAISGKREWLATFPGGGAFRWAPGEFTDDTQMALVLATHLLHCGHLDPQILAEEFADWATDSADVGNQTRAVLSQVGRGVAWADAAASVPVEAEGNGGLMRTAPVVLFARTREEAQELAALQSSITHPNRLSVDACRVYIAALWDAYHSELRPLEHYEAMAATPEIAGAIRKAAGPGSPRMSGFVVHTLTGALWAVYGAMDFADAVWRATSLGRDADTVAAVAGALAAAHFPQSAGIPEAWRSRITSRHRLFAGWSAAQLADVAGQLARRPQEQGS